MRAIFAISALPVFALAALSAGLVLGPALAQGDEKLVSKERPSHGWAE